jgi:hypothetical protein
VPDWGLDDWSVSLGVDWSFDSVAVWGSVVGVRGNWGCVVGDWSDVLGVRLDDWGGVGVSDVVSVVNNWAGVVNSWC